ncbi:MAG: phospho-N-acetylmuramoyl-pentapeptide-transferase [Alphaproteobacteria bacterium]|nr:phospho-N-acetylmuramoyl-pentapeptide-transferase [Alphaproteobacteria bacterium]MCL2889794.1 phospho-N-acetylmuramoyl-pentapeptide-transferase [Alphaproteobacteria bacterium]
MLSNFLISQGFDIFGRAAVQFSAGFAAALAIMLIFGNAFINRMRTWQKKGQPIREDGPKTHAAKAGTPTMGGLLILAAIFTASILFMDIYNPIPWIALASLAAFGAIGFVDDFGKVKRQSSQNKDALLSPKARLALGGIIAIVLTYFIDKNMPAYMTGLSIYFPIFHKLVHFGILYFVFAYFVIVGSANAANITDGLDGMLSKVLLPVLVVLMVALYSATHINFLPGGVFIPESVGLYPVLGAAMGAVLGFLWFNSRPAQIFMGDVGSLALGGFMGTVAMLLKAEIVTGFAALMMVLILGSSFLQTFYYKISGGKRVFKMAPLHHHFELSGWAETKIVERFFILSILFCAIALAILKM